MTTANGWTKVADLGDIEPGSAVAVEVGEEGRSVALFNVDGRIFATDNQCPHMGYPMTRGVIRSGVLTCDWHGRRFDLEGGGCFNNMCDDLAVFPVDLRGEEIWIQPGDGEYRRKEPATTWMAGTPETGCSPSWDRRSSKMTTAGRFYTPCAPSSMSGATVRSIPPRNQLLVGLARWATDTRRSIGSQSAAQTAQRFARGETAVELYE